MKRNSRILSLVCAVAILLSTISCLTMVTVSATAMKYAKWDFSDNTLDGITTTLSTDDAATDNYLKNTAGYLDAYTNGFKDFNITFANFKLENNSKYVISYKFKTYGTSDVYGISVVNSSCIAAASTGAASYTKLEQFFPFTTTYQSNLNTGWQKNSLIIDTTGKVDDTNNLLDFYIKKGNKGHLYIDDVEIKKLEGDSLNLDFEDGTSGGVINSNYSSPMSVEDSGDGTGNKALKLTKSGINTDYYNTYNLMLPYELSAGDYVLTYRYKTTLENSGTNGGNDGIYLTKSALLSSPNATYNNISYGNSVAGGTSLGYTKLGASTKTDKYYEAATTGWVDVEREFTITANDIEAGLSCLTLEYALWRNIGSTTGGDTPEAYIYIDDISIFKPADLPPSEDTIFDFESDESNKTFLSYALPETYNNEQARRNTYGAVEVVKDGENNRSLKVSTISYVYTVINFDYRLEAGENYEISYKIKRGNTSAVLESSGIYAAADAKTKTKEDSFKEYPNQKSSAALLGDSTSEINAARLAPLYEYTKLNAWNKDEGLGTDWVEYKVIVSPDKIEKGRRYLSLAIMTDYYTDETVAEVYIDDISVKKLDLSTVKVYANDEISFVSEGKGVEVSLPLSEGKYGYEFKGIYSDPAYTDLIGTDKITWPQSDTSYYEKWELASTAAKPIGDSITYDFDSNSSSYSAYCFKNEQSDDYVGRANGTLSVNAPNNDSVLFNFDYELESFSKYKITYTIKGASKNSYILQAEDNTSGIYVAKNIKNTDYTVGSGNFDRLLGERLEYLYGTNGKNANVGYHGDQAEEGRAERYVREIETAYLKDDCNLLSILVSLKDAGSDSSVVTIDNLIVEKIGVVNNSGDRVVNTELTEYSSSVCEGSGTAALTADGITLTSSNKSNAAVSFDYTLRSNATYKISYDIKSTGDLSVNDNLKIYVGNSFTDSKKTTVEENVRGSELYSLNASLTADYSHIEDTFVVGNNAVIDDYKFLSLAFASSGEAEEKVIIKNLKIEKISSTINANYSFEDKTDSDDMYVDYAFESGQPYVTAFVANQTDENRALKLRIKNNKKAIVNLPFAPEANATYRVSYRIKGNAKLTENANTGIFLGKLTGKTVDEEAIVSNISDYIVGSRLSSISGGSSTTFALSSNWATKTVTFTTGDTVGDSLAFVFAQSSVGYKEIYIDDIVIDRVYNMSFVTDNSDIEIDTVTNSVGSVYDMDVLTYPQYEVEGVYTDSEFKTEYTKADFTVKNKNQTYYVKYKKSKSGEETFKFSSSKEILANTNGGFAIATDAIDNTNKVLKFSGYSYGMISMPYELEAGKSYTVTFKYRANGEMMRINFALAAGANELVTYNKGESSEYKALTQKYYSSKLGATLENTRQYNVFGSDTHNLSSYTTNPSLSDGWITKTINFTANDTVDDTYKYLTLTAQIPEIKGDAIDSTVVYFDDFTIKEADAVVSFEAKYKDSGMDDYTVIDVTPIYANIGDTVTLPTELINPYQLEGWYYDAEFKNAVGETLTVTSAETKLYAKVSAQTKVTLDFEELSDVQFSYSKWISGAAAITTDPEDINNNVLKIKSNAWVYSDTRLNYQVVPDRIYRVTLRYKAYGLGDTSSVVRSSLAAGYTDENGYGMFAEKGHTLYHEQALMTFIDFGSYPLEWSEITFLVGTKSDGPAVNDQIKYLSLLFMDEASNNAYFAIDDIAIEDLGKYDPKWYGKVYSSEDWTIPQVDKSQYTDWMSWTMTDAEDEAIVDFGYSEEAFENEEYIEDAEGESTTTQQKLIKRLKKVVVTDSGSMLWLIILIVACVLVVAAGIIIFIIVKKKKKKRSSLKAKS